MATTEAEAPDLPTVRRLEAVGLRAWPAASVQYDGAWQIRLTAGHPSRRLNSVNPLDPSDYRDLEKRVEAAVRRFDAYGRPPAFRQTPLSPAPLDAHLEERGWVRRGETIVMLAEMDALDLKGALDQVPLRDVGRYVDASIAVHRRPATLKPGLTEVLNAIRPPIGMFVLEDAGEPAASVLCVHDNDMAGIFELGTREGLRRSGFGRAIARTALKWARLRGARRAWLQVESDNAAALALYAGLGFGEIYRYVYRQRPGDAP